MTNPFRPIDGNILNQQKPAVIDPNQFSPEFYNMYWALEQKAGELESTLHELQQNSAQMEEWLANNISYSEICGMCDDLQQQINDATSTLSMLEQSNPLA